MCGRPVACKGLPRNGGAPAAALALSRAGAQVRIPASLHVPRVGHLLCQGLLVRLSGPALPSWPNRCSPTPRCPACPSATPTAGMAADRAAVRGRAACTHRRVRGLQLCIALLKRFAPELLERSFEQIILFLRQVAPAAVRAPGCIDRGKAPPVLTARVAATGSSAPCTGSGRGRSGHCFGPSGCMPSPSPRTNRTRRVSCPSTGRTRRASPWRETECHGVLLTEWRGGAACRSRGITRRWNSLLARLWRYSRPRA